MRSFRHGRGRRTTAAAITFVAAGALVAGVSAGATAAPVHASAPATSTAFSPTLQWKHLFDGSPANKFTLSSPMVADLDGTPDVVAGNADGQVYAIDLANGVQKWHTPTPGYIPIDATPAYFGGRVFVGFGTGANVTAGGYLALNSNGSWWWHRQVDRLPAGDRGNSPSAVSASTAVGRLDGRDALVAGTLGQYEGGFELGGGPLTGFPWFAADSEQSTPAIVDIGGTDEVVEGGDSTRGVAMGYQYENGGHIRILRQSGNAGQREPNGGLVCQSNTNQIIQSSPAVGRILAGDTVGIVAGTGTYFQGRTVTDNDSVIAMNTACDRKYEWHLTGETESSPALVSVPDYGGGQLQVAEGTAVSATSGYVYLLDAATGGVDWRVHVPGEVIGGITSADLGAGHQDLLVPTTTGVYVLNAENGSDLTPNDPLGKGYGFQNTALVTDDSNGHIGVTIAGYNRYGGVMEHYEFDNAKGSNADEAGAWPMFHHDQQLTGSTLSHLPL